MAETQVSDVVVPSGDTSGSHPRHQPANGVGGMAGSHEGHADNVPDSSYGLGGGGPQTKGNAAGQQRVREQRDSGTSAYPPASGTKAMPTPY